MIDTNRRTITLRKYLSVSEFVQSTVEGMIEYLQALGVEGWTRVDYDDSDNDITLTQQRLETNEEYADRLAREKDAKDRAKMHKARDRERRYKDYLKLKEEFGEFREHWQEGE